MKVHKIDRFIKGWFIGNFEPSLFNTDDFEICFKRFRAGEKESVHYHKIAVEYIIKSDINLGSCPMCCKINKPWVILPIAKIEFNMNLGYFGIIPLEHNCGFIFPLALNQALLDSANKKEA